ncbi:MAG: outer membrane beta-barrel protein [Candidatus Aminicenantes bacterium]|nr:outer membrane beta-barrel protein [Candidatus Aminicenantes bacterium]
MKKIIIAGLMAGLISVAASASVGLKAIYFSPSDKDFKSIYGGGWKYGAEIAFNLFKGLDLWLDGGYYAKTGSLSYSKEETKLTLIPIGAGLRYRFLTGKIEPYIGAGARYNLFNESNEIGEVSGNGVGFVGKAGLTLYLAKGFGIDVHVAYSSCKMKPADFQFDVGGIELGAGIIF